MFFKKEKKVLDLIVQYIDSAEACIQSAEKAIQFYLDGDLKQAKTAARLTADTESEADLIRYDIRDKLYLGAYMPLIREDIYKLVENVDKVANAGEACSDFFLNQRPTVPQELKPQFQEIVQKSLGIMLPLKEALLCFFKGQCPHELARQFAKEVGLKESEVDNLEWDLTKDIFTSSLDFSRQLHLKLCLDAIVEVSDRAEDAVDRVALATLKSVF